MNRILKVGEQYIFLRQLAYKNANNGSIGLIPAGDAITVKGFGSRGCFLLVDWFKPDVFLFSRDIGEVKPIPGVSFTAGQAVCNLR